MSRRVLACYEKERGDACPEDVLACYEKALTATSIPPPQSSAVDLEYMFYTLAVLQSTGADSEGSRPSRPGRTRAVGGQSTGADSRRAVDRARTREVGEQSTSRWLGPA